jgi:hypothetical protein
MATTSVNQALRSGQHAATDQRDPVRSVLADQTSLAVLRGCLSECGWTETALAAHMGKDGGYIGKVLRGDKPMPGDFMDELPADAVAQYHAKQADRHGFVVGETVDQRTALRYVVIGLASLAAALALPAKADKMAHMTTERQPERKRA